MKFSVLLSIYYKENPKYLKLALDSIWQSQTVKPSQIVIIKDGPLTIELEKILNDFSLISPTEFIINKKNLGLSKSLNKGLIVCNNELIARMDTDDIAVSYRFEKQLQFMKINEDVDILGSYAIKIDEFGIKKEIMKAPTKHEDIYKYIWTCPFIHPTVMFRKSKIQSIGSYNPNCGPRQDDYELWFRCALNGLKFANITEPLLYYRFFSDSLRKNDPKVGWYRFKVGFKGCRSLHASPIAYIGITIPLIRSILPYPLNKWFQNIMNKLNPRHK